MMARSEFEDNKNGKEVIVQRIDSWVDEDFADRRRLSSICARSNGIFVADGVRY